MEWDIVSIEKRRWGFEIRCLLFLNKAFLCKWCWYFAIERDTFWCEVIGGKYGEVEEGWFSKGERKLWSGLMQGYNKAVGVSLLHFF